MGKYDNVNDYIGKTFGNLTVLDIYVKNKATVAKCKCICGTEIERRLSDLLNKDYKFTCGKCYKGINYNDYIGKTFGSYTIIDVYSLTKNKRKSIYAKVECTCGKNYEKRLDHIDFYSKYIGCKHCDKGKPWESHIGEIYGNLTVIGITKSFTRGYNLTQAVCKCICGQEVKRTFTSLKNRGKKSSCGECIKGIYYKNYIGKHFGSLEVIKVIKNKKNGQFNFVCKCSCGNQKNIIRSAHCILARDSKNTFQTCGECNKGIYYKNYIGKRFGYLEIKKYKDNFFTLKCDCGNSIELKTSYVNSFEKTRIATCGNCYNGVPYTKIINNTFGRLKIKSINLDFKTSRGKKVICDCSCGKKDKSIYLSQIMTGSALSCGCLRHDIVYLKKIKFGSLFIINISKNNKGGLRYICKCDCGNEIEVLESDLFTGKVTCCEECKV